MRKNIPEPVARFVDFIRVFRHRWHSTAIEWPPISLSLQSVARCRAKAATCVPIPSWMAEPLKAETLLVRTARLRCAGRGMMTILRVYLFGGLVVSWDGTPLATHRRHSRSLPVRLPASRHLLAQPARRCGPPSPQPGPVAGSQGP